MTLAEYLKVTKTPAVDLAREAGVGRSYICHVAKGRKPLSRAAAIAIWNARDVKLDPISTFSDDDIRVLERLGSQAA